MILGRVWVVVAVAGYSQSKMAMTMKSHEKSRTYVGPRLETLHFQIDCPLKRDFLPTVEDFMGTWHMVLGCFRERTYMLTMNPHITNWVPIAVPPLGFNFSGYFIPVHTIELIGRHELID